VHSDELLEALAARPKLERVLAAPLTWALCSGVYIGAVIAALWRQP
jgi:hypothetical protein